MEQTATIEILKNQVKELTLSAEEAKESLNKFQNSNRLWEERTKKRLQALEETGLTLGGVSIEELKELYETISNTTKEAELNMCNCVSTMEETVSTMEGTLKLFL